MPVTPLNVFHLGKYPLNTTKKKVSFYCLVYLSTHTLMPLCVRSNGVPINVQRKWWNEFSVLIIPLLVVQINWLLPLLFVRSFTSFTSFINFNSKSHEVVEKVSLFLSLFIGVVAVVFDFYYVALVNALEQQTVFQLNMSELIFFYFHSRLFWQ